MLDAAGMKFLAGNQGPALLVPLHVQELVHLGRVVQVVDAVALNEGTSGSLATSLASIRWDVAILCCGIGSKAEERLLTGSRREERELEPVLDPVLLLAEDTSRFTARDFGCGGERVALCAWPRPLLEMRRGRSGLRSRTVEKFLDGGNARGIRLSSTTGHGGTGLQENIE